MIEFCVMRTSAWCIWGVSIHSLIRLYAQKRLFTCQLYVFFERLLERLVAYTNN